MYPRSYPQNLLEEFSTVYVVDSTPPEPQDRPSSVPGPISCTLPVFNSQDPTLWFSIAEALFPPNSTSQDKHRALLLACPMSLTSRIRDTINALPSSHDPYATLKHAILKIVDSHPDDNLLKLLNDTPLGSSRPSDLLSQLKLLTQQFPSAVQDSILRPVFLSKLPPTVQAMLAVAPTASLSELAGIADKMIQHLPNLQAHAVAVPPSQTNHYFPPTPPNYIVKELRALRDSIQRLEQSVHY